MSDSSFSALICSLTARRMAVVDSFASTGISTTPFFSSSRVSSSSLRMTPTVRRMSSVASAKRLVAVSIASLIASRILSAVAMVRPSALSSAPPTRFSNDFITRSRSSDLFTSPIARSSSDDCRSIVCSKLDCAAVIRLEALASSLPCSSKRLAIAATSRNAACERSVRRLVLASMRRAEVAKLCAARSVDAENLSVVSESRSSTPSRFSLARLIRLLRSALEFERRSSRSSTLSARLDRAPSTAASVSAVRLASALTSAWFSLRSRSAA